MFNQIGIYDHITGKQVIREMTPQEQIERDEEIILAVQRKAQFEAEMKMKAETKKLALEKLGLTAEEAQALFN